MFSVKLKNNGLSFCMAERMSYSVVDETPESSKPIIYKIISELVPSAVPEKYPEVPIIIPKRRHLIPSMFVTALSAPLDSA